MLPCLGAGRLLESNGRAAKSAPATFLRRGSNGEKEPAQPRCMRANKVVASGHGESATTMEAQVKAASLLVQEAASSTLALVQGHKEPEPTKKRGFLARLFPLLGKRRKT